MTTARRPDGAGGHYEVQARCIARLVRSGTMSASWTGHHSAIDSPTAGGPGHAEAVVGRLRRAAHAGGRAAAGRDRAARRDRRRAARLWRLTLADHVAMWRARRRPHATPGWWPR